nr:NADH dehydrogenase subunit 6 [Lema sp. EMHAU-15071010]
MILILILMILMTIIFNFMKHPLSMGMILLNQTILISLITGMMQMNFWYSYILFIIMIGGMLILFMYMTSVASNEKFKFSFKLLIFLIITFMFLFLLKNEFTNSMMYMNLNLKNLNFSLNKYYNSNSFIMYLMFFYLLITMIMTTKITKIEKGSMRQMLK